MPCGVKSTTRHMWEKHHRSLCITNSLPLILLMTLRLLRCGLLFYFVITVWSGPHVDSFQLERPISPNHPTFKPISIANKRSPVSTRCLITGFGSTNPNTSAYSPILMTGTTYIISQEACKKHFSFLHDHIICAMRGSESCAGDSGGPLVCEGKLLGIMVMGGGGCGKILGPTGSTDVSKYLDWIARNDGSTGRLSDKYQVILMPIIPIIVIVLNYYL